MGTVEGMAASGALGAAAVGAGPVGGSAPAGSAGRQPIDPVVAAGLPRAGFWVRMGALAIDVLLVSVVLHLLGRNHGLSLVLLAAYGAVMWKVRGTSVGGIVFDLQVVRLDGQVLGWETAIVRALGCFLSLFVAGLGFFWIAFDPNRQAWHDKIAGTVVVRVPKAPGP